MKIEDLLVSVALLVPIFISYVRWLRVPFSLTPEDAGIMSEWNLKRDVQWPVFITVSWMCAVTAVFQFGEWFGDDKTVSVGIAVVLLSRFSKCIFGWLTQKTWIGDRVEEASTNTWLVLCLKILGEILLACGGLIILTHYFGYNVVWIALIVFVTAAMRHVNIVCRGLDDLQSDEDTVIEN